MGVVVRQSFKSIIFNYVGVALGAVNLLWLLPLVLTPEEFGLTRVLLALSSILVLLGQLGISSTLVKYFHYFPGYERYKMLFFSLAVCLTGFAIVSLFYQLFKNQIVNAYADKAILFVHYFYYILPLTFFVLFARVLEAYSRAQLKIVVPTFSREVVPRLLTLLLAVALIFGWFDFGLFIDLFVLSYSIPLLVLVIYVWNLGELKIKPSLKFVGKILGNQEIRAYAIYTFFGGASVMIVASIDTVMLGYMEGLSKTAVYSIAFFIGTVIQMPMRSIGQIVSPIMAKAFKEDELGVVMENYKKSVIVQMVIGGGIFILIVCNIGNCFKILPDDYGGGEMVIWLIACSRLFDMATGANNEVIMNSKYFRFNMVAIVSLAFLAVVFNLMFIPMYGINGAALASALSILLFNLLKFIFVWYRLEMQPYTWKNLVVVLIVVIVFGLNFLLPELANVWIDLIYRSLILGLAYLILNYFFKTSSDINNLLKLKRT